MHVYINIKKNGLFDICENLTFYYSFSLNNWLKQLFLLMRKKSCIYSHLNKKRFIWYMWKLKFYYSFTLTNWLKNLLLLMGKKTCKEVWSSKWFFLSIYKQGKGNGLMKKAWTMNWLVQILTLPHKSPMIIKLSPMLSFWMGKCIASLAYVSKNFSKKIVLQ